MRQTEKLMRGYRMINENFGVTDKDIRDRAAAKGFSEEFADKIANFMENRFGIDEVTSEYVDEWINRFEEKSAWNYSDSATREILESMGLAEAAGKPEADGMKESVDMINAVKEDLDSELPAEEEAEEAEKNEDKKESTEQE